MIHTRQQLIDWLKSNVSDRVLKTALEAGSIWLVGGFDPLPASASPGWIIQLKCRGKEYLVGVAVAEVTGEPRWYRAPFIPWANYAGGSSPLYAGDRPQECKMRKQERLSLSRVRKLGNADT